MLNAGYCPPSVSVLDITARRELGRSRLADGWLGLVFSPSCVRVYVVGGSQAAVFEFHFEKSRLELLRTLMAVPGDQKKLDDFVGDVAISQGGRFLYAAILHRDAIALFDLESDALLRRVPTRSPPERTRIAIRFAPDARSFFASG